MTDRRAAGHDGDDEYPGYPHTPEEFRRSFIVNARSIEERLYGLSQDVYGEVAQVWNENPPTHAEIAARIKTVLDEGLVTISADFLAAPALAADRAWGFPASELGEEPELPHT